jgi:hypothetical protein
MATYVNLAALQGGTFGTTNNDEERHRNDIPLSLNWNADNCSQTPENAYFIVNFLRVTTVDTLVLRLFEKDNRTFTFHQFESSVDSVIWTEILPPGSTGKGAFKVTFDSPRIVSQIRIRGRSTAGPHLHVVRFQAFNMSGKLLEVPSLLTPQSTGLYKIMSGDYNRDAAWKVISLPSGTSFTAGENAIIIQNPHPNWKPAPSTTSAWIGVTPNGNDGVPKGDYQFQTSFTIPSPYTSLDVGFSADDNMKSIVVSSGSKSQKITSFNGNGSGALNSFTLTDLSANAVTTMTFTVYNDGGLSGLLVQFGAYK